MHNLSSGRVTRAVAALWLLAGCAGPQNALDTTASPNHKITVEMKANNFAFDPAIIVARTGDILTIQVTDVSGEAHNLTVKNPAGTVIADKDIPARQTVTVEVPLTTAGVYPFYCDKPFHESLGMKGRIEVK